MKYEQAVGCISNWKCKTDMCQKYRCYKPAIGTVIWLHGLGESGDDFCSIGTSLGFTRCKLVFPNAPLRPVTINGGYVMPAWYDITTLKWFQNENILPIYEAASLIEKCIEKEMEEDSTSSNHSRWIQSRSGSIVYVGRKYKQALGGIVVLSGYMLLNTNTIDIHPIPVIFIHQCYFIMGFCDLVVK